MCAVRSYEMLAGMPRALAFWRCTGARRLLLVLFVCLLGSAGNALFAATFTVVNANDSGLGSLRQAILDANAMPGADQIAFHIPNPGVHTISPLSSLPPLTDDAGATIDGYSQPGSSPNTLAVGDNAVLLIELNGTLAGSFSVGIALQSASNSVRGLVINRFYRGILVQRSSNTVTGCFVGSDPDGSNSLGNRGGIDLEMFLRSSKVAEFSTKRSRSEVVPPLTDLTIGGSDPGARNLVSGNLEFGVGGNNIADSVVEGNYIGTTRTGMAPLANGSGVIFAFSSSVTIGGSAPGAGNLISGNAGTGIALGPSIQMLIRGNFIGTNATGSGAIPNQNGIAVAQADESTIGGAAAGEGNIISGNLQDAIRLGNCRNYVVQGNLIGTDSSGSLPIPNLGRGVYIFVFSNGHRIGGQLPGERNVIAFNGGAGVTVGSSASDVSFGDRISGNSIHDNAGLGIDLGGDGVTTDDPGDGDAGPNGLQNYPVLSAALSDGISTQIQGTLESLPTAAFEFEFFASPSCDSSGNGEGQTLLGRASVITDSFGKASFLISVPFGSIDQFLTATATDAAGNTSEFSACAGVTFTTLPSSVPTLDARHLLGLALLLAAAGALVLARTR